MFGKKNHLLLSEESKMESVQLKHEKMTELVLVTLRDGVK